MATTTNLGKLRFDWRGDYLATSSYVVNDVVTWRMQQYICTADANAGVAPSNTSFWTLFTSMFNNRGQWASGQSYLIGDVVLQATPGNLVSLPASISGQYSLSRTTVQAYYCTVAHTSSGTITPADSGYWTPMNRKGVSGAQTGVGSTTQNYNLGIYSNSPYAVGVIPNRGIMFDNTSQYYLGSTGRNSTDSWTAGAVSLNGQAQSWGRDINGSNGLLSYGGYAQNALTFPFYDYWRSSSAGGSGIHSTPNNDIPRVIQWEKSYDRNLVLMNSGEVFAWGSSPSGQLGNQNNANSNFPVRVGTNLTSLYNNTATAVGGPNNKLIVSGHVWSSVRIKRISMSSPGGWGGGSGGHCMAIDENGQLWTWGNNSRGQLGWGTLDSSLNQSNNSTFLPQPIPKTAFNVGAITTGQNVVACWACGAGDNSFSFAVTADGNLWAWGDNQSGQLGLGNTSVTAVPTVVNNIGGLGLNFGSPSVGNVVKLQFTDNGTTAARAAVAIVTSLGLVYVAGCNNSGWMGIAATASVNIWTNIGGGPGASANTSCRDLWLYGSGGDFATCMQRDRVTGFCWTAGRNTNGVLGYGGTAGTPAQSATFALSKINVGGVLYNLTNVRQLAHIAHNDTCSATVVLDNGLAFSIGRNDWGVASLGFTSTNSVNADANTIEMINQAVWQPVRAPSNMIGKFQDCMGFGQADGASWFMWQNNDGRIMMSGRGSPNLTTGTTGANPGNMFGQYRSSWSDAHVNAMTNTIVT
jgi:alpha-tubulin suppressor-like RCC1 family protein